MFERFKIGDLVELSSGCRLIVTKVYEKENTYELSSMSPSDSILNYHNDLTNYNIVHCSIHHSWLSKVGEYKQI